VASFDVNFPKKEIDERLKKVVGEAFEDVGPPDISFDFTQLEEATGPTPRNVPKLFGLTPLAYMSAPVEHFTELCEEHSYQKIMSSLTYILNIGANGDEVVIERTRNLMTALREQKTTESSHNQNESRDLPAQTDDDDNL
jgi:hypothetical protein